MKGSPLNHFIDPFLHPHLSLRACMRSCALATARRSRCLDTVRTATSRIPLPCGATLSQVKLARFTLALTDGAARLDQREVLLAAHSI